MSGWWNDFFTLLFKHTVLATQQAAEVLPAVVARYWQIARRVWLVASVFIAICLAGFFCLAAFDVQSAWLYPALMLLIAGALLVMMAVALPLLTLSEAAYGYLPQGLRDSVRAWVRRGGAILFGTLLTAVFVSAFGLWQSPGKMLLALLILATLGVGGAFGWLKMPDGWQQAVAAKLLLLLVIIGIVARFPIVGELVEWVGGRSRSVVYGVTRPTPERWHPTSINELRFVDEGTGSLLVWYYRDESGNFELYKSKGFHRFGTPLKQAETDSEFTAIRNWQRANDLEREAARRAQEEAAARAKEEEQLAAAKRAEELAQAQEKDRRVTAERNAELARKQEEERVAAAERSADLARKQEEERVAEAARAAERLREAERLRRASYVAALPTSRVDYIVYSTDPSGKASSEVHSSVVSHLARRKDIRVAGNVFADAFASAEGFEAFAAGKGAADLAAMHVGDTAKRLLLIHGAARDRLQAKALPVFVPTRCG